MPKISAAHRESRRQTILDAALACFAENGFHQTVMADIVGRSGMSHGAVYGYFESKDDIIEALADDRHARETVLNSVVQRAGDPREGIRALVRAYAQALADPNGDARRRVGVHGWAEALRNPRVRARVIEGIRIPLSLIIGLVEQGQSTGLLSNTLSADAVARSFVALFQGFALQTAWGESLDIAACVAVIDAMIQGLSVTDERPQPRKKRAAQSC